MTNAPENKPLRLDQKLTAEGQTAGQTLLDAFPELRSITIVFDYDMPDRGSLPSGVFVPRDKKLRPLEYLGACKSLDDVSFGLRREFDRAEQKHAEGVEKMRQAVMSTMQQNKQHIDNPKKVENIANGEKQKQQEGGSTI